MLYDLLKNKLFIMSLDTRTHTHTYIQICNHQQLLQSKQNHFVPHQLTGNSLKALRLKRTSFVNTKSL